MPLRAPPGRRVLAQGKECFLSPYSRAVSRTVSSSSSTCWTAPGSPRKSSNTERASAAPSAPRSRPTNTASIVSVTTCEANVFVTATPISGAARMYAVLSVSWVIILPTVFVTASVRVPAAFARRTAPSVSAVSPLWVTAPTSVRSGVCPAPNAYSLATLTIARTPANSSNPRRR